MGLGGENVTTILRTLKMLSGKCLYSHETSFTQQYHDMSHKGTLHSDHGKHNDNNNRIMIITQA